jgi:hypothetical protein
MSFVEMMPTIFLPCFTFIRLILWRSIGGEDTLKILLALDEYTADSFISHDLGGFLHGGVFGNADHGG